MLFSLWECGVALVKFVKFVFEKITNRVRLKSFRVSLQGVFQGFYLINDKLYDRLMVIICWYFSCSTFTMFVKCMLIVEGTINMAWALYLSWVQGCYVNRLNVLQGFPLRRHVKQCEFKNTADTEKRTADTDAYQLYLGCNYSCLVHVLAVYFSISRRSHRWRRYSH